MESLSSWTLMIYMTGEKGASLKTLLHVEDVRPTRCKQFYVT